MAVHEFDANDPDSKKQMQAFYGGQVDHLIRQAAQYCWMAFPPDQQNPEAVGKHLHRMVDRALRDLREDMDAFGINPK
jgi:hypothetical protein